MRQFLRFIFQFLYTRNWYTGRRELSRPRVILFVAVCLLIIALIIIATYLEIPVVYSAV